MVAFVGGPASREPVPFQEPLQPTSRCLEFEQLLAFFLIVILCLVGLLAGAGSMDLGVNVHSRISKLWFQAEFALTDGYV